MYSKLTYTYKIAGDCAIQADVYRPDDTLIRPVIFWVHGGALIMGNRDTLHPDQLAAYVNAGYAIVTVDYRLAPEIKLPTIIEDIQDAYRWLCESGPNLFQIDPDWIGVIGHSAGGYLTLMTGFCVTPAPRALVAFYGYGDIIGEWYSQPDPFYRQSPLVPAEEAHKNVGGNTLSGTGFDGALAEGRWRFYLYCRQQGLWPQLVGGHDPVSEAEWFMPYCPVHNVTADYPPTLFIHGDEDDDVPAQQSIQMAEALKLAHVEHELAVIPNRGHGFDYVDDDPVVKQTIERVLKFLEKHLRV